MKRSVQYSERAAEKLNRQIDYLIEHDAVQAAINLRHRVDEFIANHLALYPEIGRAVPDTSFLEVWISKTRLSVWYEYDDNTITIIDAWHTSQNRQK